MKLTMTKKNYFHIARKLIQKIFFLPEINKQISVLSQKNVGNQNEETDALTHSLWETIEFLLQFSTVC